ncbi:Hypothetical predicted protein [Mytilus galloprovincialis]|uniref:Uncharacterized protein n=1 Tax=Mytilus galloprovincialis TaxID=29158 RepID=A0A8B6CME5_MYTGA|nr:Hypothetical predicted protein [Mytilus galloprovincialis]
MEAGQLLDKLLNKQIPVETAVNHDDLEAIEKELESCLKKWLHDFSWLNELIFYNCPGWDHSTKDITHMRRSKGIASNVVIFTEDMPFRVYKETFLANYANKQRFVTLLKDIFIENGIDAIQAEDDAYLLIVQTAVTKSLAEK